jgi:plastocyanin
MRGCVTLLAWLCATSVSAADLTISVKTANGAPVADAVATVYPASGVPAGPIHFDWPMRMAQQDLHFNPFVLIAPLGAVVAFPNMDKVRHHVYSFSPAHPFELKLYGRDETRSVRFDKAGVIALGCNIHDTMIGFIKVVDTPYAAKTNAEGVLVIHDLPPGSATVRVWRPYLKAPNNEVSRVITAPSAGSFSETFAVEVRPPAAAMAPMPGMS